MIETFLVLLQQRKEEMINEKTYFDWIIGKWRFLLKQNYQYTDKETGKVHMNKLFSIQHIDTKDSNVWYSDGWYIDWLNFYTGWHHPRFVYNTIEYEGNRHNLSMSLGYGLLYMYFPWRNKHADEEDVNNPEPKYGFYLYSDSTKFFDSFWYHTNKNGKNDVKCVYMPWSKEFYRHSIYLEDGSWWTMLESERRKARKEGIDTWSDARFYLPEDSELIHREKHPFNYVTKNGEVQETTATCFIEEREWRPRCLRWTKLFNTVCPVVNIQFADAMGNQRGSWKGGVIGVSAPMTKEEVKNKDIESALSRYEERVNRIHDYCR